MPAIWRIPLRWQTFPPVLLLLPLAAHTVEVAMPSFLFNHLDAILAFAMNKFNYNFCHLKESFLVSPVNNFQKLWQRLRNLRVHICSTERTLSGAAMYIGYWLWQRKQRHAGAQQVCWWGWRHHHCYSKQKQLGRGSTPLSPTTINRRAKVGSD